MYIGPVKKKDVVRLACFPDCAELAHYVLYTFPTGYIQIDVAASNW